jgi:hypothetical protein
MESRDSIGFSVHTRVIVLLRRKQGQEGISRGPWPGSVTWVSWDAGSTYQRVEQGVSLVNDVRAVAGYRMNEWSRRRQGRLVHVHVTPRWTPIEARRAQRAGKAWADRDVQQIAERRGICIR